MLIGSGSLRFDVGPGCQQQGPFIDRIITHLHLKATLAATALTWPCGIAPSISSLCPQSYRRTGSPASLVGGSGRNHKTTGERGWVRNRWRGNRCRWQRCERKLVKILDIWSCLLLLRPYLTNTNLLLVLMIK